MGARLADLPGVLIVTANQAQGLERKAVVVIHPLAGYREARAFATDPGRLCVALSRHHAHATVVVDTSTEAVLQHAQQRERYRQPCRLMLPAVVDLQRTWSQSYDYDGKAQRGR